MSVATEITRIQTDRNKIRNKLVNFGLVESTANLDTCAEAIDGIVNQGAVSATVQEGDINLDYQGTPVTVQVESNTTWTVE